jgi:hypothetical protein
MLLQENVSEAWFLLICYHMVLFVDLISAEKLISMVGISLIVCMTILLAGNIALITVVSIKGLLRSMKLKKYK